MVVLFMKDIEFHTLINSVTEVVYVVSMHCGLPGLNYQDSQKKIFTHEGLSAHAHNNYCWSSRMASFCSSEEDYTLLLFLDSCS